MWIRSAETAEIERQQELLLEELARKDPKIRRVLEEFQTKGIPPAESTEEIAEQEYGLTPEEVADLETTELSEHLEQQGSMAGDRLAQMISQFHDLANQGIPPTLAYLEVSVLNKLSILECDTFWEALKSQAENLESMMDLNASEISKHVHGNNREAVHRIVAKLKHPSNAKTYVNRQAKKQAAKRVMSSTHGMLPTEDITRLANEAATHLKFDSKISWTHLCDAIAHIADEGKIHALASKIYDCEIDYANIDHLPLYQGVSNSVIFVLQCILEKAGYEWDPKTAAWIK